jgi:peroxiredoxin (alkyl hydroperoxide reductase subunit C)
MTTCNAEAASVSTQQTNVPRIPLIGEPAPGFTAVTTQGSVHFPEDYKGKWVMLFSHPADFTRFAPPSS